MDEDDDIYVPEEPQEDSHNAQQPVATRPAEDLEEGEEEDSGGAMDEDDDESVCDSDSNTPMIMSNFWQDIDIITERKDGTTAAPPRYNHQLAQWQRWQRWQRS